jgi:hypothetical protein
VLDTGCSAAPRCLDDQDRDPFTSEGGAQHR